MGKNTIKFYQKLETRKLKILLKNFEIAQNNTENIMEVSEKEGYNVFELVEKISDFEIDIRLIRMELNKRLWKDST